MADSVPQDLVATLQQAKASQEEVLNVPISYQIIKLLSEGLYRSPNKAIEELVSNSYDAGATRVDLLLQNPENPNESIWVIDNGVGMNKEGFRDLWKIAKSHKADTSTQNNRLQIGQFGIGKLAAYVLARHLTHISRTPSGYFFTTMDFNRVETRDIEGTTPLELQLQKISKTQAKASLREIERRSPDLFESLFSNNRRSWTAAALTEFKELGTRIQSGMLKWVLRTGLPLSSGFSIVVDGDELVSAGARREPLFEFKVGDDDDDIYTSMKLDAGDEGGIAIPGIGLVEGVARIYRKPLDQGKASEQYHRNNGIFVRVRNRIINLHDELFGLRVQSHGPWSRFYLEVRVDGLHEHLLSSREGVRENDAVRTLRTYMQRVFSRCRQRYDAWKKSELSKLDINQLVSDSPSALVTEPLIRSISAAYAQGDTAQLRFVAPPPSDLGESWFDEFSADASAQPFSDVTIGDAGPYGEVARYEPASRKIVVNRSHPYVTKVLEGASGDYAAQLVGSSEIMTEALLYDVGVTGAVADEFLERRDRVMRLLAGTYPANGPDALRFLDVANENADALERATGLAFQVLGFEYEPRGGNRGGTDGVLTARLGLDASSGLRTYKVVFDAKSTGKKRVAADKLDFTSLVSRFQVEEGAELGFFLARGYEGGQDVSGKANTNARSSKITLLDIGDLKQLVELHMRFGVTLDDVRSLLTDAHDVPSVKQWLAEFEQGEEAADRVPLRLLLETLEELKSDEGGAPTVSAARASNAKLKEFHEDKLRASLHGVEQIVGNRFLVVERDRVKMNQAARVIVEEVARVLTRTLDLDGEAGD